MIHGEQDRKSNTPVTIRRDMKNFSSGINSYGAISYNILNNAENASNQSVKLGMNMDFEEVIGHAKSRKGSKLLGDDISDTVDKNLGLTTFYKTDGEAQHIAVFEKNDEAVIYYLDDNDEWKESNITDHALRKHRFAQLGGRVFCVNGQDEMISSSDGQTWNTDETVTFDTNIEYIKRFKGRMIALRTDGVFYFSSIVDPFDSPSITWDEDDSMQINPEDGGFATGMETVNNVLVIFKNTGLYRVDVTGRQIDPKQLHNIGAVHQEAITSLHNLIFFYSGETIYQTDGTSPPEEVSRPIRDIVESINNPNEVYLKSREQQVYIACGNIEADGTNYQNTVLRFSITQDVWTLFTYPFRIRFMYDDQQNFQIIAGSDDGVHVIEDKNSFTDSGNSIPFELKLHDFDNGKREAPKILQNYLVVYSKGVENASLKVGNEEKIYSSVKIRDNISDERLNQVVKGRVILFELTGMATNNRFIFEGITFWTKSYTLEAK